ncbi:MAG: F0F1 ATP synthase subunit epsilon [Deltaproteobacteria bacterium]|nr:F0F1 ATP synthase subunit epsilon [Deltaproteobacteria bacterium]
MQLEISTPSENIPSQEVDSVTLPAYWGETQVLPGHAQLITNLVEGNLQIQSKGQTHQYSISSGIADISQEKVLVLCEGLAELK